MARTYDPGQHFSNFAGITLSGYAEGTFISVERAEDAFTKQVGSAGEVARVRNRNRSGRITLTLMATSPVNDLLSAKAKADEISGTGQGPFTISDGNGTTVVVASSAWVVKVPTTEFAKEMPNREWVFDCEALDILVGGNND